MFIIYFPDNSKVLTKYPDNMDSIEQASRSAKN